MLAPLPRLHPRSGSAGPSPRCQLLRPGSNRENASHRHCHRPRGRSSPARSTPARLGTAFPEPPPYSTPKAEPAADAVYFGRGLLTNLLNPKAAAFNIAVLQRFLDPAAPALGQTLLLALAAIALWFMWTTQSASG
jgi:hypothetical protein